MVSFKGNDAKALRIAKEEYLAIGEERVEARGKVIGEAQGMMRVALRMLKDKSSLSLITAYTNLIPAEVRQIAKENGLAV